MSLYSSCNHYRTICSNVKRLTSVKVHMQQWYNIVFAVSRGKFAATSKVATFRSCHQWRWICSNHHIMLPINTKEPAASWCSCHQYRAICSHIEWLRRCGPLKNAPALMSLFCSCHQWKWICSTATILFLLSVQDNLQKRRKAMTFRSFEERSGSDAITLSLPSVRVILQ